MNHDRGWYHPRGGAGSLSFGRGRLPGSHGGRFRLKICKHYKKNERERGKGGQIRVEGKMNSRSGIYRAQNLHHYVME